MFKTSLVFFLGVLLIPSARITASIRAVVVPFYSEKVSLAYNTEFIVRFREEVSEKNMLDYYQQLSRRDYTTLLSDLESKREALQLNDWLFYELLRNTVREILPGCSNAQWELTCWFLLSQLGFDTRLTYYNATVFLYVFTTDEVFEVPLINENGRIYVNLTNIRQKQQYAGPLYMLNYAPHPQGRPFTFYLSRLPSLRPSPIMRSFEFGYGEYTYQVEVEADETVMAVMERYPFIAEQQYLEVPLSNSISHSLLPQLRRMLEGKSQREAVEFLVAFTRSSFQYKDDKEFFGRSKPMIADEVFHYPFSDCEDRSALFYRLVRALLDLPMIVIAYEDHLTIGVALSENCGKAITYRGRDYFICDPTGPVNSTAIGQVPKGYETRSFEIIGAYY